MSENYTEIKNRIAALEEEAAELQRRQVVKLQRHERAVQLWNERKLRRELRGYSEALRADEEAWQNAQVRTSRPPAAGVERRTPSKPISRAPRPPKDPKTRHRPLPITTPVIQDLGDDHFELNSMRQEVLQVRKLMAELGVTPADILCSMTFSLQQLERIVGHPQTPPPGHEGG